MKLLFCGCILFFGVHSVSIAAPAWRERMVARFGLHGWQGVYSLLAAAGLAMMVYGYGEARLAGGGLLYTPAAWSRSAAAALMLPVFPLLLAAYLPGRIGRRLGHPMLLATLLWSLAHLTANGGAADVLLFGSFALWAAADWGSVRHRKPRAIRRLPTTRWNDAVSLILGLALYALMVAGGHRWLTGVPL